MKGRKSSKSAPSWTVKPSMDEVKDKIFLTYEEAAVLLGVSARTVWGLVSEGEIPHIKLASAVRVRRADLDAWAEAKATASRGAIKPNRDAACGRGADEGSGLSMASLNSDKHGPWRVQFVGRDGCRPTIRLGAIPKRQAESIKLKIEALVSAMTTGMRPDDETQRWVQGLHDDLHAKVAAAGLVEPRGGTRLGSFVADYIARREVELKFNTLRNLRKCEAYLVEFFGRDRDLREITAGDAADFRTWLLGKGLGENSVRGFVKRAKHFFSVAIGHELLARNPFAKVPSTVKANPRRFYFVSREEAEAVLGAVAGHLRARPVRRAAVPQRGDVAAVGGHRLGARSAPRPQPQDREEPRRRQPGHLPLPGTGADPP